MNGRTYKFLKTKTFKSELIFSSSLFLLSLFGMLFFLICVWTGTLNEDKESIDFRIIMDSQYLTLWTSWTTTVYLGIKAYNSLTKKDTLSTGFETMVLSLLIMTGLIYDLYMSGTKSWPIHQVPLMFRTIIEHVINPIVLLVYMILYVNPKYENVSTKQIFIDSIRILVFVIIYFIWITVRSVSWVMTEEGHNSTALQFPYDGFSPSDLGWTLYSFGVIGFITILWGFYIGMYYAIKKQTINVIKNHITINSNT